MVFIITSKIGEMVMEEGKVYTEGDWTNTESASLDLYSKSKTLAERAAWDFVKELPGKFFLIFNFFMYQKY